MLCADAAALPPQNLVTTSVVPFAVIGGFIVLFSVWMCVARDSPELMRAWREEVYKRHGTLVSPGSLPCGACAWGVGVGCACVWQERQ